MIVVSTMSESALPTSIKVTVRCDKGGITLPMHLSIAHS